ncbi:proline dehydrogenase family protein [Oceanobacillus senegalensis]|uniref:proline dehydrogenase family protein n=1 Tax=Oceanobacillus senegalensis TaxID=1936063 RepID=UPI000A30A62B|nr:proline dehydrogenase family protein [Oceanobacillus senegalensis]
MKNITRNFFIGLSNNKLLNENAKRWGGCFGSSKFIAGTTIESVVETVKLLNQRGISCTLDNLGEFVVDKLEAAQAKEHILTILDVIAKHKLDCHMSVKLTQLGLDIEQKFCVDNMREIVERAKNYNIFINIDMEDHSHYVQTLKVLQVLRVDYDNIGTVVQSYLYRAENDLEHLKDVRLRIVKGAYKENEKVAYQTKKEIDRNFILLAKKRLLGDTFTSIATHDHHIINELKEFIKENNISKDRFEFQMLYGFRTEMHHELVSQGYLFCTYIPFGKDWFGYFMRRLAERPQNMNLILKDLFDKRNKVKKKSVITVAIATAILVVWRRKNKII